MSTNLSKIELDSNQIKEILSYVQEIAQMAGVSYSSSSSIDSELLHLAKDSRDKLKKHYIWYKACLSLSQDVEISQAKDLHDAVREVQVQKVENQDAAYNWELEMLREFFLTIYTENLKR